MGFLSKIFGRVGKSVSPTASSANYRKVQSWDALSGENSQKMYAAVNKTGKPTAAGPSSIPLSKVEGLPEGGAGQRSRHAMNPASQGTGADQGFGSGWQKLAGLGGKLARMTGFGSSRTTKMLSGIETAFPGIGSMSREQFMSTLEAGGFSTKFADDMGGATMTKSLATIQRDLAKAGKLEHGMQVAHIPAGPMNYEKKVFALVQEGKVQAGGYIERKSANAPWQSIGLYSKMKKNPAAEGFSMAKVIFAQMMEAGGYTSNSLSRPAGKSLYDIYHSIRVNMQHGVSNVKSHTTTSTVSGLATPPVRGGSSKLPTGGTGS